MSSITTPPGTPVDHSDDRAAFLIAVQGIGVFIAAVASFRISGFCQVSPALLELMQLLLVLLFIVSALIALMNDYVSRMTLGFLWPPGRELPQAFRCVTLSGLLLGYTLADLFILALLVHTTGGSRQSLYCSFLFIIVPVTIVLRENPWRVAAYAALTIIIFCVMLRWRDGGFAITNSNTYDWWWAAITGVCVSFPTTLFLAVGNRDVRASQRPADGSPNKLQPPLSV